MYFFSKLKKKKLNYIAFSGSVVENSLIQYDCMPWKHFHSVISTNITYKS